MHHRCGSSVSRFARSAISAVADGSRGKVSPFSRPAAIDTTGPPPIHSPFRSTVPSGSRGDGPVGAGGRRTSWPRASSGPGFATRRRVRGTPSAQRFRRRRAVLARGNHGEHEDREAHSWSVSILPPQRWSSFLPLRALRILRALRGQAAGLAGAGLANRAASIAAFGCTSLSSTVICMYVWLTVR